MGDVLISSISRFSVIIKGLKQQIYEIEQIRRLMHSSLPTFLKALNRMNSTLEMLAYVFQNNSPHNELFKHKLLKFSQIETIVLKLEPLHALLRLLSDLKDTTNFRDKVKIYLKLYMNYSKPSTIHYQMKKYFKIIEEALPIVIDLNSTIFGSAIRIQQPILRKAWMLVGDNQLNDSSLPINIVQDNLFMLLKLEIDENTINKTNKKEMYKNIINQIVDDIDNRGATKGDGNISLAELNDLPEEVMGHIKTNDEYIDEYNYEETNEVSLFGCCFFNKQKLSKVFIDKDIIETNSVKGQSCKTDDGESTIGDDCMILATDFFDRYKSYLKKKKQDKKNKTSKKETEEPEYEGLAWLFNETNDKVKVNPDLEIENDKKIYWNTVSDNVPPCVNDYGHDFHCKKIATLTLKNPSEYNSNLNDNNTILTNIVFKMEVKDQGWGGTNNVHVRYQINNEKCIKAFTVNRDEKNNPKNKYKFIINGCELNKHKSNKNPTKVSVWLYCPPWTCWEAEVLSIKSEINYN